MVQLYKLEEITSKTRKVRGIKTKEYGNKGKYPIIDQGSKFIAGYTNNEDVHYKDTLPVVVFGDHTLAVKYIDFPFCAGADGTQVLKPNEEVITGKFLYYSILNLNIQSLGYSRHFKILKEANFLLPSLENQKGIVKILDAADTLRQQRKQAIELLDDYLKSVFLEMFGDPVKNPNGWEIRNIGEYFKIQGGFAFKSIDYCSEGIKLVKITNVHFEDLTWNSIEYVPTKLANEKKDFLLKENDFLMALTRPIIQSLGVVKTVTVKSDDLPCLLNQRVARFMPKQTSLRLEFLRHFCYTHFFKKKVEFYSSSALQPNISTKQIEAIPIFNPPLELQNKFAIIVKKVEQLKKQMLTQSKELDNQFQALMQKAFKGEL